MRTRLINLWDSFRTGFWFLPTLLILAAVVLAILLPELDRRLAGSLPDWLKTTGDTARSTLAALASAMFAVAGVVFSVTVVTLSITSSQLGPRLLRNFLSENITQATMGSCVACSIFCLLLLWRIDDVGGNWFVPHLSVAAATVMTVAVLCLVVYFIHRVAHAVQSMHVVAEVADDLDDAVMRLFPERIGEGRQHDVDEQSLQRKFETQESRSIPARADGYLQAVNGETLLELAVEHDLLIRLDCRPGDFLIADRRIARCLPPSRCDDETADDLSEAFLVGPQRTPRQDVVCAIDELVEVAVRALSPGINDPFTAIASIDRLSATLCRLAQRETPSSVRVDDDGAPRVLAEVDAFADVLRAGFDQIRQYGANSIAVSMRLLQSLRTIAESAVRDADLTATARQAELVVEGVRLHSHCDGDLNAIEGRFEAVKAACQRESDETSLPLGKAAAVAPG